MNEWIFKHTDKYKDTVFFVWKIWRWLRIHKRGIEYPLWLCVCVCMCGSVYRIKLWKAKLFQRNLFFCDKILLKITFLCFFLNIFFDNFVRRLYFFLLMCCQISEKLWQFKLKCFFLLFFLIAFCVNFFLNDLGTYLFIHSFIQLNGNDFLVFLCVVHDFYFCVFYLFRFRFFFYLLKGFEVRFSFTKRETDW